ncbi:hypothetical protein LEN26_017010 [Aphanomyces euteiches]|nr:hypothetical protein LEN26_017010 [Aphanomyces euteiches]
MAKRSFLEKTPMAESAPTTYGTPQRNETNPTHVQEEEELQRELRSHVESRRLRGITTILRKKRALAVDLMEREIIRTKSGPPSPRRLDTDVVDTIQTLTENNIEEDDDEEETKRAVHKWRVSFQVERTNRLLLYAEQEWKHAQQLAVESEVAHLIIRCMTPKSASKKATTNVSAKTMLHAEAEELYILDLIHEFIAGGYEPAQNALYRAMLEVYDDDDDETTADVDRKEVFSRFLLKYIRMDKIPKSKTSIHYQKIALSVVHLLCENHNIVWQDMMREKYAEMPVLDAVIKLMDSTPLNDPIFLKCMRCLSEACQGPCPENQDFIVRSSAPRRCCQALLYVTDLDLSVYQAAAEVLLSLMEGRLDSSVNAEMARLFKPADVIKCLVSCYNELVREFGPELSFERDDIHHHDLYNRAVCMMTVAVRIMSLEATQDIMVDAEDDDDSEESDEERKLIMKLADDPESVDLELRDRIKRTVRGIITKAKEDAVNFQTAIRKVVHLNRALKQFDVRSVQAFRTLWESAIDEAKARVPVRFFHSQLISVELVVRGKLTTMYFVKPHDAMYFDEFLQNELLDEMDIGSDKALEVLLSEKAKSIDEELKVVKHLRRHPLYALLSQWQLKIRSRLLWVCFYINFVMLLLLRWDGSDSFLLLLFLGLVYLVGCLVLLGFYVTKAFNLNYCKQQLTPTKLRFRSPKYIREKTWEAWQEPIFIIELLIWTLSLIVYVNGWRSYGSVSCTTVAILAVVFSTLRAIREVANVSRFSVNSESTYLEMRSKLGKKAWKPKIFFWYSVIYDTLFCDNVLALLVYSICAFLGLVTPHDERFLFYGPPLMDLVALNSGLRFVIKAMTTNTAKLTITAIFGAVVIYVFALTGYYFLQDAMTLDSGDQECHSLMHCFMTFIHAGLLNGGGIGDYMSHTPLNYTDKSSYFYRVGFDLSFYIVVIVLLLNLIQGIIIDAFTAVREASENKLQLQRQQCLVCNKSRTVIEADGMANGIMNSFVRHTETKHNIFNYFFFIKYLMAKDETEMNGMESYVFGKIKTKDMTWIPRV